MNWLAAISTKVWAGALGAVLALLTASLLITYTRGLTIKGLEADLTQAKSTVAAKQARIDALLTDLAGWQAKVAAQNAALDALKKEATERAAASLKALAEARRLAARAQARVNELEARLAAPTPPGADCKTAVEEVRSGLDLQ